MQIAILVLLLALFIFCIAFFSAAETALFSLSAMKVKAYKDDPDPRKRLIGKLLDRPRDLLITMIIAIIITSILVQNVVSSIFSVQSNWLLNVGVPLALNLVLGEVVPKSIALASNETISYRAAPVLNAAQKILYPIRAALGAIANVTVRICFFFLKREREISVEELQHTLKTSKEYGVLNADEAELIDGYLTLQEATAKELMRPREEVIFYDVEEPLTKLVYLFVDQEISRLPVCKESFDQVLGIMTSQLFFIHREKLKSTADLMPLLKKPFFIPESTEAELLLTQLYEREEDLGIVVDEYGSIAGLITLEDLVEVVVGEIADRRDEKKRYTRTGDDIIIASGKLELSEFEDIFDYPLKSENHMVTIGGWLTEQLGEIPKSGTKYETKDFLFHVLAADRTRVRRVYIRRLRTSQVKKIMGS